MSRTVTTIQVILGSIAFSLVMVLFLTGMVAGQKRDQMAEPPAPSEGEQSGAPVDPGKRVPGMPEKKLSEYETFPEAGKKNPDRQLEYKAEGKPSVEFRDSLRSHEAYATQTVEWKTCAGGDASCAMVLVPLDWDDPSGPALEIAVTRVSGAGSGNQPLFVNPGGPGLGGTSMGVSLAGRWKDYDVIGWDPRGTGNSTHVVCGTGKETDTWLNLDASPDDEAEDKALRDGSAEFARQCRDGSGDLLDHLTTIDVVRDLDLLRHVLGAEKLNYLGVSYGTYVGATYAQLFPNSVGRMILDAAVDITGKDDVPQAAGFELALKNFSTWCAGSNLCALGNDEAAITKRIGDFLSGLDSSPLKVGDRLLTQSLATTGVAMFLYHDETAYRTLAAVLGAAMNGQGEDLMEAADSYNNRNDDGTYDTLVYAFPAMSCADWADTGAADMAKHWKETFSDAPTMAPNLGLSYTCQFWTADSAPQLKLTAKGAPPILVVGTTGDSATPYEQAVSMAKQLDSGRLLTLKGAGHGAVTGDNKCIAEAVDRYLYEGTPPEEGKTCS